MSAQDKNTKMKVEIWSDVMCPFCYIGKRRFEKALAQFEHKDQVEVEWKSFQLNPFLKTNPSITTSEHLANEKGWTKEYTDEMTEYVSDMAKAEGLNYQLDKAVVANSMNAHRLSHLAKKYNKQDALEEILFKAYFEEAKNTDDEQVLTDLGLALDLPIDEIKELFTTTIYTKEVKQDIQEAQEIGVKGVPFFVFDRKYGVSGAQESNAFLETLIKSFSEV
jgi:predicted DsbA family dithiol-disulfide isomerase